MVDYLGYLSENASTNHLRNSTMVGATVGVIGSGGAFPTNWSQTYAASLDTEIVATGQVDGKDYIDVRLFGTPGASLVWNLEMETLTQIAALTGQEWVVSSEVSIVGGDITNIRRIRYDGVEVNGGGTPFSVRQGADFKSDITSDLQHFEQSFELAGGGSTAYFSPELIILADIPSSPVDLTLRLTLPQVEMRSAATSFIPTSTAAATRAKDSAIVDMTTILSFSPVTGTLLINFKRRTGVDYESVAIQIDDGTDDNAV